MASQTALLSANHKDLVTSVAFGSSASLLATASLDHHINVYAKQSVGNKSEWVLSDTLKLDAPVLRAVFGDNEWDYLLAAGTSNGSAHIYSQNAKGKWSLRTSLVDARGSLRDLAFAPSEFGLRLATVSADNGLRIYDCPSPTDNFSQTSSGHTSMSANTGSSASATATAGIASWHLLEHVDLVSLPYTPTASSNANNSSAFSSIGPNPPNASRISLGATASGISLTGSSASQQQHQQSNSSGGKQPFNTLEAHGGWALSWCKEAWWGECIAVSGGPVGAIRIFHFAHPSHWSQPLVLLPNSASNSPKTSTSYPNASQQTAAPITSLDWSASSGRSYQVIAAGHRDGMVRIWKVWPPALSFTRQGELRPASQDDESSWTATCAAELDAHVSGGGVGRVQFNVTGTVLSSAGDDGKVRLWKPTFQGEWREVAQLSVAADPGEMEEDIGETS